MLFLDGIDVAGPETVWNSIKSPIERSMFLALVAASSDWGTNPKWVYPLGPIDVGDSDALRTFSPDRFDESNVGIYTSCRSQQTLNVRDKRIRPDFIVCVEHFPPGCWLPPDFKWGHRMPEPVVAVIECDGHDYHERTKEQAERDRSRDRAIQEAGWLALRFTGREIHRDVWECASEVWSQISAKIGRNCAIGGAR